jgi:hypothetical protein
MGVHFGGYANEGRRVTVVAGQSVEVDFRLRTDPLQMDEVVVTGKGGLETSRARLGNALSLVGSDDLQKVPIRNRDPSSRFTIEHSTSSGWSLTAETAEEAPSPRRKIGCLFLARFAPTSRALRFHT